MSSPVASASIWSQHFQPSTPSVFNVHSPVLANNVVRRILMPTVRPPRPTYSAPPTPRTPGKNPAHKRSGRVTGSLSITPADVPAAPKDVGELWFGKPRKFDIVQDQLQLDGYQLYAVEKWVTERSRAVVTLAVYTGDPTQNITVTALSPCTHLSSDDAQAEWDAALRDLRQAGARPRDTGAGVLMVTSLANFRSDYTIVHVPSGRYLDARERLFTNINLLRMGCAGRTALTLEEPSEPTKDRFLAMYRAPAAVRAPALFSATILELVRLVQAGLVLFGMYLDAPGSGPGPDARDGLLCDATVDGIARWAAELGEPLLGLEPAERIADPAVVCALLSTVAATRARLHALGFTHATHGMPKDPFADPAAFRAAVAAFTSSRLCTLPAGATQGGDNAPGVLNADVLVAVAAAHERSRQAEQFKLHRRAMHKLDELREGMGADGIGGDNDAGAGASAGGVGGGSGGGGGGGGGSGGGGASGGLIEPTADLARFVRAIEKGGKEVVPSLRSVWSARAGVLAKRERERERLMSDEEEQRERERAEKERRDGISFGLGMRDGTGTDEFSSASDAEHRVWAGRKVQRKIEAWAARAKKNSVDHQNRAPPSLLEVESPRWQSPVPEVVISNPNDEEEILSSGQISPTSVSRNHAHSHFLLEPGRVTATTSLSNLSEFDRRLSELYTHDRRRPGSNEPSSSGAPRRPPAQQRIVSWSDPRSARELTHSRSGSEREFIESREFDGADTRELTDMREYAAAAMGRYPLRGFARSRENLDADFDDAGHAREETVRARTDGRVRKRRLFDEGIRRRRSFADARTYSRAPLSLDNMKIDVDLCGQLLIQRRRAPHLSHVMAVLSHLSASLAATNAALKDTHRSARPALSAVSVRAAALGAAERAAVDAGALAQDAQALGYESAQFEPAQLWRAVAQQRRAVFGIRRKVRAPVPGSNGRAQRTLGGAMLRVDALGRTEGEAEEERGLPELEEEEGLGVGAEDEFGRASAHGGVAGGRGEGEQARAAGVVPATWFLRVFESWTARWRKRAEPGAEAAGAAAGTGEKGEAALIHETETETDGALSPAMSLGAVPEETGGGSEGTEGEHAPWTDGTMTPPARAYSPESIIGFESD